MIPNQTPTPKARSHGIAPRPGKEQEPLVLRCKALDKEVNPRRSRRILSKEMVTSLAMLAFHTGSKEELYFSNAFDTDGYLVLIFSETVSRVVAFL